MAEQSKLESDHEPMDVGHVPSDSSVAGSSESGESEQQPISARLDRPHDKPCVVARTPAKSEVQSDVAGKKQLATGNALPLDETTPLAKQAASLSESLTGQLAELDRRSEAIANQEADVEAKLNSARLWFDEQHTELEARAAELEKREAALEQSPEEIAATAANETLTLQATEELDKRSAELDARQAELYQQIERTTSDRGRIERDTAKLWEQTQDLEEAKEEATKLNSELAAQRREIEQQSAEVECQQAEMLKLHQRIEDERADVEARETRLAARQAEVQAAIKRFESLNVTEERIAKLTEESQQHAARVRYLDESERLLTEERAAVAEQRHELEQRTRDTQEKLTAERRKIEAKRAEAQQLATTQKQEAEATQKQLDQRQAALEQLQGELERGQREVLEMRLATEETWAQLAGSLAPASLTRSISQVRTRLADHYQHTLAEMAERRRELDQVSTELTEQHERLEQQRTLLQEWASRREEDIEQRAANLVAREHELDRQQRHYEHLEVQWALEKEELRDEIRKLMAEMRQPPLRVAA